MPRTGRPKRSQWDLCSIPECGQSTQGGAKGLCSSHYHQLRKGLIDEDGKETGVRTRLHQKGTPCLTEGCTAPAVGRGLCAKHYQREIMLPPDQSAQARGSQCTLCGAPHRARGFCQRHYAQLRKGNIDEKGNILRPLKRVGKIEDGSVCRQPNCGHPVRTRGWCNKHYIQYKSGIIDEDGQRLRDSLPNGRRPLDFRKEAAGYILVRAPKDHPYARHDGSILEHRLVMEHRIGEYIDPDEFIVHHKDGDRANNSPDNLEVQPYKTHGPGKDADVDVCRRLMTALKYNDPESYYRLLEELN